MLVLPILFLSPLTVSAADRPDFESQVAPVLIKRCLECHNERTASGGLVLTNAAAAAKGGDSGVAIVAKRSADSLLVHRLEAGEMPPEQRGQSRRLPDAEIDVLRRWIDAGARWPAGRILDLYERTNDVRGGRDWWSFQPIRRPSVPKPANAGWCTNPIDAFVRARQEQAGIEPAPRAEPAALLRRVYYDLVGLPPTYEQVRLFVADPSEQAWERVVDDLLASPHFGERWARHWLDVVRFAETSGYERDQEKPFAWRYRDWVVQAINADMPYDQFVLAQLAGDELPTRSEQSVVATGFLRLGTWNDEPNDPDDYKYERLEDLVHATSSAFLGLTVKCARCHDHKFDPIPQEDYYRLAAAFWPGPIEPRERELLGGPSKSELGFPDVLGWTDVRTTPPLLHLLKNGERHHPGPAVEAGSLTLVPVLHTTFISSAGRTTNRRRQLASWVVDPRNPLPARVMVNRLWQHHFGEGLVRSPNNFGFTGDKPVHGELLDWLATELIGGGWTLKRLHKQILMSSVWRQSSLHPRHEEVAKVDGANRLCWRAERRRLDAESLRDSLLAVTGEIDLRIGGPSFRPTIAPEALEGLSRKEAAWDPSLAAEQNRRSLYIYTKRGLLPPILTTFDFADTTLPCEQRDATTVAPQALAMLNNPFVHARSRALARRVHYTDSQRQITKAWNLVFAREPASEEMSFARQHLDSQRERFSADLAAKVRQVAQGSPAAFSTSGLVLHLRADAGVELDESGRLLAWRDASAHGHHAAQPLADRRPLLAGKSINGKAAIRFDGKGRFLHLDGKLLAADDCTIFAVVTDQGAGHREIVSNWDGAKGNIGDSVFLGLTAERTIRWTDNFAPAGTISDPSKPFVLTAVNGPAGVAIYQDSRLLASRPQRLATRRLDTKWVVGQQGNIGGEYWTGDIAELIVFDRPLRGDELQSVWTYFGRRYDLPVEPPEPADSSDPAFLALASLCHVLLNSNELLYID